MTRMCIYDDDIEFSLLFEKLLYRYAEENDKEIDVEIFQGGENAKISDQSPLDANRYTFSGYRPRRCERF